MTKKTKNKKTRKLLITVFVLVFILTIAKLLLANVLATTGNEVGKLEAEALTLKEERQLLEEELSKLKTLSKIAQEAEKLGFKKANSVVFLQEQVSVALR